MKKKKNEPEKKVFKRSINEPIKKIKGETEIKQSQITNDNIENIKKNIEINSELKSENNKNQKSGNENDGNKEQEMVENKEKKDDSYQSSEISKKDENKNEI